MLAGEAVGFLERSAAAVGDGVGVARPFFLYFSLHDIHVPRVPHPRFVGSTDLGPRGDAIVQADWCVGEVLRTLDDLGLADDTLVLFTSDNGPVLDDGYRDDAAERLGDHDPNGPWRGGKYSALEAGTRVPWVVRWPGRVAAGGTSDALVSHVDLPATFAAPDRLRRGPVDGGRLRGRPARAAGRRARGPHRTGRAVPHAVPAAGGR